MRLFNEVRAIYHPSKNSQVPFEGAYDAGVSIEFILPLGGRVLAVAEEARGWLSGSC